MKLWCLVYLFFSNPFMLFMSLMVKKRMIKFEYAISKIE